MKKLKVCGRLLATLALFVCLFLMLPIMGNAATVSAEETTSGEGAETPVTPEEGTEGETGDGGLQTLVDGFLAQLKAKYGEDYETYYNAILAEWGSVEEYLLSLIDENTPDAVASGWTAFVKWLSDYAPIWGSVLAIVAVIIVVLFGKKALNKVVQWITGMNTKFKTIVSAFNTLYASEKAQNEALVKLLGENERFAEERKALEEANGEIEKDETV